MLIRITSLYFVAGIITESFRVVRTAPILKYMKGWMFHSVEKYVRKKGWKFEIV